MHVVRNRAHVVEELAKQVPSAFALHHIPAEKDIARSLDRIFEEKARTLRRVHVAQSFVRSRVRAVRSFGGRRKPSFVDPAAMGAERIEVVRMELQSAPGDHERSRHPAWLKAQYAPAGTYRFLHICTT